MSFVFHPLPRREEPLHLLTVGRLTPRKNVALALRALGRLASSAPWHYDVVGGGDELPALIALASEFGISERVTFHGTRPDVDTFYRKADALLFPSLMESVGLVMLEAMSWGVPVLAPDDVFDGADICNRAVITTGKDGFLATSEDDFGRKIAAILDRTIDLDQLRHAARTTFVQRFTWEEHVGRLEAKLCEMVRVRAA